MALEITNSEQLEAFLELLSTNGVEEFEGFGFHVRFSEACFSPARRVAEPQVIEEPRRAEPAPVSAWEDPSLWPGGRPPAFPRREP